MSERPRSGIFGTLNGIEYQADSYPADGQVVLYSRAAANPDPDRFAWNDESGAWLATVPVGECDRLMEVTTRCDYAGLLCQVVAIAPTGATGLYYLGEEPAVAADRGFHQIDPGTWAKTVNIYDLQRVREHHRDLIFDGWSGAR